MNAAPPPPHGPSAHHGPPTETPPPGPVPGPAPGPVPGPAGMPHQAPPLGAAPTGAAPMEGASAGGAGAAPVGIGGPTAAAPGPADVSGPAGLGRRAASWLIDFALALLVAIGLGWLTWNRISTLLWTMPDRAIDSAGDALGSGDILGASLDFGSQLWDHAAWYVVQAFAALIVVMFAYHFVALSWKGRTLGMLVLDLRVVPHRRATLGKGQAVTRAAAVTTIDLGLYALACSLLVHGWFVLSVLCWIVAVAVFFGNVLPIVLPGRRTVHDRLTGTRVVRGGLYRAAAEQVLRGGRAAWEGAQQGAQRVAAHEGIQRLRASDPARSVQELGSDAVAKGRDALARAKQAYADRKGAPPPSAAPAQQPPPPAGGPTPRQRPGDG